MSGHNTYFQAEHSCDCNASNNPSSPESLPLTIDIDFNLENITIKNKTARKSSKHHLGFHEPFSVTFQSHLSQ